MVKHENDCVSCAVPGYPCLGSSCPNRHVAHYYCDDCGDETTIYEFGEEELCIDCVVKRLKVVEGSM